ncbi:hypothetical protein LUZ60_010355 [Juncus effusus]|nr:hypothetical protein LUZ60_010355 [Juncus effusus]
MADDHEPLVFHFSSSPCNIYYVESPSTITTTSHLAMHPPPSTVISDDASESNNGHLRQSDDASRLVLSRYSSSRGSNNSFLHEKKTSYTNGTFKSGTKRQVLRIVRNHGEDAEEDQEEEEEHSHSMSSRFWRFVSIDPKSSMCSIMFQLTWRLAISIAIAMLVFFLATKPPTPHFSLKVDKIEEFRLGEGSDTSGVITNILDCNCSMSMQIENYSKVFGLRVDSTVLQMAFGVMNFAISHGEDSYVNSQSSKTIKFFITVKNKPMYAAGRNMQDLLDSNPGLQIMVRLESRLLYHVVGNLIKVPHRVKTECFLVLQGSHKTRMYNSFCPAYNFHA